MNEEKKECFLFIHLLLCFVVDYSDVRWHYVHSVIYLIKGKAIPVTGHEGLYRQSAHRWQ
jgi:hypothetical protein